MLQLEKACTQLQTPSTAKNKLKKKKEPNALERSILPNKESKVMIIKKLNELGRKMDEHSEKFNREFGNIKESQTELKNISGIKKYTRRIQQE